MIFKTVHVAGCIKKLNKIVVGVYLDIRKAFDCVRHSTLLDKLHKIGISCPEHNMCIIMDVTQVRSPLNTECLKDLYWGHYFSFYL